MSPNILQSDSVVRHLAFTLCGMLLLFAAVEAGASGFPPVAANDSATVTRGRVVAILDSGAASVLANDLDIEGDQLFAFLSRTTAHGELTFNSDGTFLYRHNGNNRNIDNFFYFAYDGTGFSERTRVRITIVDGDPVPPQIVGQEAVAINEDASLSVDIESLEVVDPDNIFPEDFTLEVGDGENYTRVGTSITPVLNFNGSLLVPVRVFDGTDFSNQFSLNVGVTPVNDAPFTVGTPLDQEAIENVPFDLDLAGYFDDIDSNDSLRFSASGLPQSRSLSIDLSSGILSGTPLAADVINSPYRVRVSATDLDGGRATIEFGLMIFADNRSDLAVSAELAVNPVTVNEDAQWNMVVENLGPADLEEGELVARWSTSGPALSLVSPEGCTVAGNDSNEPSILCPLSGLAVGTSRTISVVGVQAGDGDNSLIAVAVADDPIIGNNTVLVGAQIVAEFSEGPTQILEVSGTGIASGDFNNDGLPDLAVTSDQTVLFFNDGSRTVTTPGTSLGEISGGAAVLTVDWNNDNRTDVVVAGAPGADARVFINGDGEDFSTSIDMNSQGNGSVIAAASADFDQNGFDDLVLTGSGGTTLLLNFGDTNFSLAALPTNAGLDVSVADVNNDSFPDLIVVESADRSIVLLQNAGDGTNYTAQRLQRGSVASATGADLNGDGSVDLLLAIDGDDLMLPESRILYQASDGSYPQGETIGASSLSKMLAGDVDGDLVADIIAFNAAGVHQLYRGNTTGDFTLSDEQIVSAGMRGGMLVDFNNDDSLDLIMAGPEATVVEIHANNGLGKLGLGDRIAPVLQLVGETSMSLAAGASFVDPGFAAEDDIDGDVSDSVLVKGVVNTSVVGTYTLSYTVADRAGNQASASRVITVGIREGLGGGGGGVISPLVILLQLLVLIVVLNTRNRNVLQSVRTTND